MKEMEKTGEDQYAYNSKHRWYVHGNGKHTSTFNDYDDFKYHKNRI